MTTILHCLMLFAPTLLPPAAAMVQRDPAPIGCLGSADPVDDPLFLAQWDRAQARTAEACGAETIAGLVQGVTEASLTPPRRP